MKYEVLKEEVYVTECVHLKLLMRVHGETKVGWAEFTSSDGIRTFTIRKWPVSVQLHIVNRLMRLAVKHKIGGVTL